MFLFNRKYQAKNARPKSNKITFEEQALIGLNVLFYFIAFFMVVNYFQKTFMSFGELLSKFSYFLLVSIVLLTIYAVSKGLISKIVSFVVSFGVIAPSMLAIYLGINYHFSSSYINHTFMFPDDFEISIGTQRLTPVLTEKFKEIPNLEKLDLPLIDINSKVQSLYVKIDKGMLGYFVVKDKRVIEK